MTANFASGTVWTGDNLQLLCSGCNRSKGGRTMADGPRYRMIGNGIAVNCLRWVGERIAMFERISKEGGTP